MSTAITKRAIQLDISLEALILDALTALAEPTDSDDIPKDVVLESLRISLEDVKAGRVYPIRVVRKLR
ncbi:MAG: hypothetical protein F6K30_28050 [Cyanothece sp. SIO2G6]|nr:hypothetical protein [Cyanothece sp. SIO2G6]